MLRNGVIGLLVLSFVVAIVLAQRREPSKPTADPTAAGKIDRAPDGAAPDNGGKMLKPINPLPISQVVLFNSGVGYFRRTGEVDGDARVDLQFQASDINDLIKSLVIDDANGKVLPLRYDSQEPIEKALHSFAINLSTNPSFGQILNQARGEKVELSLAANTSGLPGTLTGTIVGMESGPRLPTPSSSATADVESLNLMCAEGLRAVPVNQVQRLRFLNPAIENELRRALDVVASGHDSQKKVVRLGFRGQGKREVKVGYVTENPIWKTSYRLVLGKDKKTKLLGWATVENTSDEDWNEIKLALVSSRPISFQMDLYPPLFVPRPIIEPELFASLRPPTYAGPMNSLGGQAGFQGGVSVNGMGQLGFGGAPIAGAFGGGVMLGNIGGFQGGAIGGLFNGGLFNGGRGDPDPNAQPQFPIGMAPMAGGNRYQIVNPTNANQRLTYKDLQQRKEEKSAETVAQAKQVGSILTGVDPDLIESALTADQLGNMARFVIDERVTLPRQQSAMLPILDQSIESSRISIFNEQVQAQHPLLGLKIKNNSKQSLMQGPIAVYEDGQYAGDGRILDLQPGEERFVSYAIDVGTEVMSYENQTTGPEMKVRMEGGKLLVQFRMRNTRTYVIKNRSVEDRRLVIEHPRRGQWQFTEARKLTQVVPVKGAGGEESESTWKPGVVERPSERTRDLDRFTVDVKAGETVKYEVSTELPRVDPFQSTQQADWAGFATTLGLDTWVKSVRTPEGHFGLAVAGNMLKVTHEDRRTTTYWLRNRGETERTVWLEHIVPNGRRLVGDAKPESEDARRYRFKLLLPPGKSLTQSVVEELEIAQAESVPIKTSAALQAPETAGLPADRFITELGFEVWQTRQSLPETLMSARLIKGDLQTSIQNRELVTYHIHNAAAEERAFLIDHQVRPQWSFVGEQKPLEGSNLCYRFSVKSGKDQRMKQEVTEEQLVPRREALRELTAERIKALVASARIGDGVKDSIKKGTQMIWALAATETLLKDLRAQLKEITDEQSRIKGNLEKLPAGSDVYKRLIDKFDKQETALEKVQGQIAEKSALEKVQQKELAAFLEKLNVE